MDSKKLKIPANIAIAGAGGIGGFVAQGLYDYGVNRNQYPYSDMNITIFDDDTVDPGNLLHQNFTEEDLGKHKAELLAEKYVMTAKTRFMTEKDFKDFDMVFSCVDSMSFRKSLYEYGWKNPGKLAWIDGRCQSRSIGVYTSEIPKKDLTGDLTDSKERAGCLLAVDKKNKVSHITPQVVAAMMMQAFLNHIRGEPTQSKILMYI